MVARTALVIASSTDTEVCEVPLTMYTRLPSGLTVTADGALPTGTVPMTALVNPSITVIVLSISFVIYTRVPSG